jgi:phage terminase small subunit
LKRLRPSPPRRLSPEARKLWRALYDSSLMDPQAELMLNTMLEAFDRMREAQRILAKDGPILEEKTAAGNIHHRPHPALAIERDSRAGMIRAWRALGYDELPEGMR